MKSGFLKNFSLYLFPGIIFLLYFSLIPIGHWQDEYTTFTYISQNNSHFIYRIFHWSPRPLSEIIIFLYAKISLFFNKQFILPFLLFMWSLLFFSFFYPLFKRRRILSNNVINYSIFYSLVMFSIYLSSSNVSELFYWPLASVAYLPVVAIASFILLSFVFSLDEEKHYGKVLSSLLILSSLSSECGAVFSFVFSAVVLVLSFLIPDRQGVTLKRIYYVYPILFSLFVFYSLSHNRLGASREAFNPDVARHIDLVIIKSIVKFLEELVSSSGGIGEYFIGLVGKLFFCVASYLFFQKVLRKERKDLLQRNFLILSVSCFASVLIILLASYYQFGFRGCLRHIALRQCLIYVGFAEISAMLSLNKKKIYKNNSEIFLVFLILALVLPFSLKLNSFIHDYRIYGEIYEVHKKNWKDLSFPSKEATYINPPLSDIAGDLLLPLGIYKPSSEEDYSAAFLPEGMVKLFRKEKLVVINH